MNDQRPTRWPCSADSRRNAGCSGRRPRSLRNAETGVSQSSMNVWRRGTRLCSRASSRDLHEASRSSAGAGVARGRSAAPGSAATAIEHLLGVGQRAAAAAQQHREVVQDVGGLLVHALVGLLARGASDLLGLLLDLRADRGGSASSSAV